MLPSFLCHAELVSASIPPTFPIATIAAWTLKQVQGDGHEFNE
jgi:hypothetical protein